MEASYGYQRIPLLHETSRMEGLVGHLIAAWKIYITDQKTVYRVASEIRVWSLQQAPISPFVVGDESLNLVLHFLVSQEDAFNPCYLGKMTRDEKPHRATR